MLKNEAQETAESLYYKGDLEGAMKIVQQEVDADPKNPLPLLKAAEMLRYAKNVHRSLEYYNRAVEAAEEMSDLKAQVHALRGECYSNLGEIQKAREDYKIWVELEPESPIALERLCMSNIACGQVYQEKESIQKALEVAEQALKVVGKENKEAAPFYYATGFGLLLANQHELAIQALENGIAVNEKHAPSYELIATTYHMSKKFKEAIPYYEQYLQHASEWHTGNPMASLGFGDITVCKVLTNEAECFLGDEDVDNALKTATAATEIGEHAKSLATSGAEHMQHMIAQVLAKSHYIKGVCHGRKNEWAECASESTKALEFDQRIVGAWMARAEANEQLGKKEEAEQDRKMAGEWAAKQNGSM